MFPQSEIVETCFLNLNIFITNVDSLRGTWSHSLEKSTLKNLGDFVAAVDNISFPVCFLVRLTLNSQLSLF